MQSLHRWDAVSLFSLSLVSAVPDCIEECCFLWLLLCLIAQKSAAQKRRGSLEQNMPWRAKLDAVIAQVGCCVGFSLVTVLVHCCDELRRRVLHQQAGVVAWRAKLDAVIVQVGGCARVSLFTLFVTAKAC
jgi:hypothetical protein